jgi:hypothetical protein
VLEIELGLVTRAHAHERREGLAADRRARVAQRDEREDVVHLARHEALSKERVLAQLAELAQLGFAASGEELLDPLIVEEVAGAFDVKGSFAGRIPQHRVEGVAARGLIQRTDPRTHGGASDTIGYHPLVQSDGAAELLALPIAPGDSPFRVKGVAFRGHLDYVAAHVPGGVDGMLADFADPRLRSFFSQPFLAASFYDVFPLAIAGIVCAKRCGVEYLEFVRMRTEAQAKSDLGGVYRVLLKFTSAEAVAVRLPKLLGQYFDFGETEVVERRPNAVRIGRAGMPSPIVPWYVAVSRAYLNVVMQAAGSPDSRCELVAVENDGARAGVKVVKIVLDVSWG